MRDMRACLAAWPALPRRRCAWLSTCPGSRAFDCDVATGIQTSDGRARAAPTQDPHAHSAGWIPLPPEGRSPHRPNRARPRTARSGRSSEPSPTPAPPHRIRQGKAINRCSSRHAGLARSGAVPRPRRRRWLRDASARTCSRHWRSLWPRLLNFSRRFSCRAAACLSSYRGTSPPQAVLDDDGTCNGRDQLESSEPVGRLPPRRRPAMASSSARRVTSFGGPSPSPSSLQCNSSSRRFRGRRNSSQLGHSDQRATAQLRSERAAEPSLTHCQEDRVGGFPRYVATCRSDDCSSSSAVRAPRATRLSRSRWRRAR